MEKLHQQQPSSPFEHSEFSNMKNDEDIRDKSKRRKKREENKIMSEYKHWRRNNLDTSDDGAHRRFYYFMVTIVLVLLCIYMGHVIEEHISKRNTLIDENQIVPNTSLLYVPHLDRIDINVIQQEMCTIQSKNADSNDSITVSQSHINNSMTLYYNIEEMFRSRQEDPNFDIPPTASNAIPSTEPNTGEYETGSETSIDSSINVDSNSNTIIEVEEDIALEVDSTGSISIDSIISTLSGDFEVSSVLQELGQLIIEEGVESLHMDMEVNMDMNMDITPDNAVNNNANNAGVGTKIDVKSTLPIPVIETHVPVMHHAAELKYTQEQQLLQEQQAHEHAQTQAFEQQEQFEQQQQYDQFQSHAQTKTHQQQYDQSQAQQQAHAHHQAHQHALQHTQQQKLDLDQSQQQSQQNTESYEHYLMEEAYLH